MFTSKKRRPQGYNNNTTTTTSTTSTTTNNLIRKQIITTTHSVKIKKQLPPTNSYHPSPSTSTSNHNHNDNDNNSKRKRKNNDSNDKNDNANRDKSRKSPTPFSDESEGETIRKNGVDKLMKRKQSDSDPVSRQISASQDGTVQCLTAEQLVLDNREAYIERKLTWYRQSDHLILRQGS
jgi:esterase/lipase